LVEKSAEIIPKVMGVHKKHSKGHWTMPEKCPCCHHTVVRPEGFVDFYCENNDCPEQVFARLKHATGKSALDIDGCGEVTVRELMDHGVRTLSDLFTISDWIFSSLRQEEIHRGPRARQIAAALAQDSRPGDRRRWPVSQPGHRGRWNALYAVFDELPQLKEMIGESLYESWKRWFDRNAEEIDKLIALGFHFESEAKTAGPAHR
jgi:hypothetical protein